MKKFFITSDIHNDYDALISGLDEIGFDINNPDHILVVAGDVFDRGRDAVKLYGYLKELTDKEKAIVLAGNHDEFLIQFLEQKNLGLCYFNFRNNGTDKTIDDFLGQTLSWDTYVCMKYSAEEQFKMTQEEWNNVWAAFVRESAEEINVNYPELLQWIKSLPDYLELEHSIITHGMIDESNGDWHNPLCGWKNLHWAKPNESANFPNHTGKHIYVGHINSDMIRDIYGEDGNGNEMYTRPSEDVTYLDSCSILTHKLNFAVIEDNFIK